MSHGSRTLGVTIAILIAATIGCARERLQVVKGRVTFQGVPVVEGVVLFNNEVAGISLTTKLQPDGSFEVGSYQGVGLPVGSYLIAVQPPIPESFSSIGEIGSLASRKYENIPHQYRDPKTSGLTAEVRPGSNAFSFDLLPKSAPAVTKSKSEAKK